ncbi:MAG: alpha/beta hydrolase [Cyclobacteriaceae bacterium]
MKKIYFFLFGATLLFSCSEDDGLSGTRFVDDIFADVDLTFDIKYGSNAALVGVSQDLYLDVYEPMGDSEVNRPLIVMAHGGSFVTGTKTSIRDLCKAYARKGYVVASIGYRLINDPSVNDSIAFSEGVVLTIGDMKAAIRYLRNDALTENNFNVNPNLIFAGGVSAGAIIANHIAYLDETDAVPDYLQDHIDTHGGLEGNTNDIDVSSEVIGVLSFSGSLFRENWITSEDPPIFMVHEEFDQIVPCNYEASDVFPFPILAYGACELKPAFEAANVLNEFIFIEGSTSHVGYFQELDADAQDIIDSSATFLSSILNQEI